MIHPFLWLSWLAEQLHITAFFEETLHIHESDHILYGWLVALLLLLVAFFASRRKDMVPTGIQNLMEACIEILEGAIEETMGEKGRAYFPLIATFALFILISNLMGLIPGFYPSTANINTDVALALTVFVMTHVVGIKEHGLRYVKHFMGPILWLAPFMFILEVIGHLARPLSLSLRLFGNMWGHEIILMIFLLLMPYFVPSVMMALGFVVALIQTYVFTLLAMAYIAGSLDEAH